MCGRFTLTASSHHQLALRFAVDGHIDISYQPRYNIAPSQPVLAVISRENNRRMGYLQWGLIPFWAADPKIGQKLINARSETAAEKPAFRGAFARRRCLIPADGFYEWDQGSKPRQPYYLQLQSGEPFAFAGLWEQWKSPQGGEPIYTCTILTTAANDLLRPIHPRMPVILPPDQETTWLQETPADDLKALFEPFPSTALRMHPVSTLVNVPKNDRPECIIPR